MVILTLEDIRVTRNFNMIIHKNKFLSEELKTMCEICKGTVAQES